MYIADKYWNNYIGDSDDSLTLVQYLADKQKKVISLTEIFSDIGLDKLDGDFRQHEEPLSVTLAHVDFEYGEPYAEFYYAINPLVDLAALLLECRVSGSVDLYDLFGNDLETEIQDLSITATAEEYKLIDKILTDFVSDPLAYDVSEMCPEEEMLEMAAVCEKLRKELCGGM